MASGTIRPDANGAFNTWSVLGSKAVWEEVSQEAIDATSEPLTSRGIKSPAELSKRQGVQFTLPTLSAGEKVVSLVLHVNGKWTAKLKIVIVGTGALVEREAESSAASSKWAGATGWTVAFPWSAFTKAELEEKAKSGEKLQVTFNTGKASVQEIYECYFTYETTGGEAQVYAVDAVTSMGPGARTTQSKVAQASVITKAPSQPVVRASRIAQVSVITKAPSQPVVQVSRIAARSIASSLAARAVALAGAVRSVSIKSSVGARASTVQQKLASLSVTSSSGPRISTSQSKVAQARLSTSPGASEALRLSRTAPRSITTSAAARATLTLRAQAIRIRTSVGARVTVSAVGLRQTPLFPTATPSTGRLARVEPGRRARGDGRMGVAQAGRLGKP